MFKKIFLLIIITVATSGCWDRSELNNISIAEAMGIDKVGEQYQLTVQVVNSNVMSPETTSERSPVTSYTAIGPTIFEALRRVSLKAPRKIHGGHIEAVIISEEIARNDLEEVVDVFLRDHEIRSDFLLLLAKDVSAYDVLSTLTPTEKIPAVEIISDINANCEKLGVAFKEQFFDTFKIIVNDKIDLVLSSITVEKKSNEDMKEQVKDVIPSKIIAIAGLGIFKDNKLLGWMTEEQSIIYNKIMGFSDGSIITIPCKNGVVTLETSYSPSLEVKKNNELNLNISIEGVVADTACDIDLTKDKTINELEKKINTKVSTEYRQFIEFIIQEYNADIFRFASTIYKTDPMYWEKNIKNDPDYLSKLKFNINVKTKINRRGTARKTIKGD